MKVSKLFCFIILIIVTLSFTSCGNNGVVKNENFVPINYTVPDADVIDKAKNYLSEIFKERDICESISEVDYRILYSPENDKPNAIVFEFESNSDNSTSGYAIVYIKSDMNKEGMDLKVYSLSAPSPYKNVPEKYYCYYGGHMGYYYKTGRSSLLYDVYEDYPPN
ncbi:MAG: hypothetical protein E7564_03325 [Ruminococcaceae bacterium]|nr:hypothetical protein [Oscillospiraceae bacterium]